MASVEDRLELLKILADELRNEISNSTLGIRIEELLEELNERSWDANSLDIPARAST